MKVLSIKQPWASLIASGIKDIENRTWKTNFRGRILIHASAATVFDAFMPIPIRDRGVTVNEWLERNGYEWNYNNIPHSAIIGEVDIIDCVINHPSIWAEKTERLFNINSGKFLPKSSVCNWVLANPALYDEPILNVKGKLSFWEFTKPENFK
jgi:hypothetical protein